MVDTKQCLCMTKHRRMGFEPPESAVATEGWRLRPAFCPEALGERETGARITVLGGEHSAGPVVHEMPVLPTSVGHSRWVPACRTAESLRHPSCSAGQSLLRQPQGHSQRCWLEPVWEGAAAWKRSPSTDPNTDQGPAQPVQDTVGRTGRSPPSRREAAG